MEKLSKKLEEKVQKRIERNERVKGRPLTPEEREKIINNERKIAKEERTFKIALGSIVLTLRYTEEELYFQHQKMKETNKKKQLKKKVMKEKHLQKK